jgi:hypothetical protein
MLVDVAKLSRYLAKPCERASTSRVPHFKLKVFPHRAWHLTNQNQRTIRKGFTERDWCGSTQERKEWSRRASTKAAAGTVTMICYADMDRNG